MLKNWSQAFLMFLLTLGSTACGGGESPVQPTPQSVRGTDNLSGPPVPAQSATCWDYTNAQRGGVSVTATPSNLHVFVGPGSCSAPQGGALADGEGELSNVDVPAGRFFVVLRNNTDGPLGFTLSVTYWH